MHPAFSPHDLLMQLFSLQRRRTNVEDTGENSSQGRELLELIMAFNAEGEGFSDEVDD